MSILEQLNTVLAPLGIQIETGVFSDAAPDTYIVIVPLVDTFELHADDYPGCDVQEARLAIYSKGSYTAVKNNVVRAILGAGMVITSRDYIGYEPDTGYHHYNVDALNIYDMEE